MVIGEIFTHDKYYSFTARKKDGESLQMKGFLVGKCLASLKQIRNNCTSCDRTVVWKGLKIWLQLKISMIFFLSFVFGTMLETDLLSGLFRIAVVLQKIVLKLKLFNSSFL